jgi:hypothetical protein
MRRALGHDFSRVRVHEGPLASASARALNAHAYTIGQDIVFAAGRYDPHSPRGDKLLAHELAHTAQQAGAATSSVPSRVSSPDDGAEKQADAAANALTRVRPLQLTATPRYYARQIAQKPNSQPCPTDPALADPCDPSHCSTQQASVGAADIGRARDVVVATAAAVTARPRPTLVARALDWFFGADDDLTASTVATRLGCISVALDSAIVACDLVDSEGVAYTCVAGTTPICGSAPDKRICFSDLHFASGPQTRAETAIHEAGHLVGLSLREDVYNGSSGFLDLSTNEALETTESFALFAVAVGQGQIPSQFRSVLTAGGGVALSGGSPTWFTSFYAGREWQRPKLTLFNPGLGIGAVIVGESGRSGQPTASRSALVNLVGSLRIGEPRRPGSRLGWEASLSAGLGAALVKDESDNVKASLGAELGVAAGYHWHLAAIKLGANYLYDSSRSDAQVKHLLTVGLTVSANL